MIDLTPLDVRKKREDFKRAVRGYDSAQVDAFLELVSDRLEQIVREHGTLSDQVAHMQAQLETYQEREHALNEALLAAQELREEARSQSERDAAVRLREAETHAEAILLDADQAIRHSQRRLQELRARRRQFLKSLRSVMERFEDHLELEEERLETEPEDLGDLLERLDQDLVPPPEQVEDSKEIEDPDAGEPRTSVVDAATSRNGQSDLGDPQARDTGEETESGSRIAAPVPIAPADSAEEQGKSTT